MTHQQQLSEERESERQRIAAAQMQPNSARANYSGGIAGIAVCDNAGCRRYATLDSSAIDALVFELLEAQRQLRTDMLARSKSEPPPTKRSGQPSSNPPPPDATDRLLDDILRRK